MSLRNDIVRIFNELVSNGKKISDLPEAVSVAGVDLVEISQGGVSKKVAASLLASGGSAQNFDQVLAISGEITANRYVFPNVDDTLTFTVGSNADASKIFNTLQFTAKGGISFTAPIIQLPVTIAATANAWSILTVDGATGGRIGQIANNGTVGQVLTSSGGVAPPTWKDPTGGGGGTWGSITGTLSDQTDLQAALDAKASITYVDSRIEDVIVDGETAKAPSQNAVFDALAAKLERAAIANSQTGTTYTLQASDFSPATTLYLSNASAQVVTIPDNATTPIPAGVWLGVIRSGAGGATFSPQNGSVTLVNTSGSNTDAGIGNLFLIRKRPGTTNTWEIFNGGLTLGSSNQLLGVNNAGTAQEYKTVSNGLTSAAGTLQLGGALTANVNLSGAFSLGIGASPSAKLHVVGLGTTTGEIFRLANNTPTTRLSFLDNGQTTWTGNAPSGSATMHDLSATFNATAATGETLVFQKWNPNFGANTTSDDLYILQMQNNGTDVFRFDNLGQIYLGSGTGPARIGSSTTSGASSATGPSLLFRGRGAWGSNGAISHLYQVRAATSASNNITAFQYGPQSGEDSWTLSSGNVTYGWHVNAPLLNVSGGTNTFRLFDYAPTETAIAGITSYYGLTIGGTNLKNGFNTRTPNSTVHISGSISQKSRSVTATTTLDANDYALYADATSGAITVNLPAVAGVLDRIYVIKRINSGANAVTLDASGSETIDGSTTQTLSTQYSFFTIQALAAGWMIIGQN